MESFKLNEFNIKFIVYDENNQGIFLYLEILFKFEMKYLILYQSYFYRFMLFVQVMDYYGDIEIGSYFYDFVSGVLLCVRCSEDW